MTDYQKILFPYAYNILGTVEDARDVVQDVISKHLTSEKDDIAEEQHYLIRSTINHAINVHNRNNRVVPDSRVWLPEPVATDDAADRNLHLKEILSYSLMVLLEKLNATERAVFILKESFDYSHHEISQVLDITEEHSRKLLSRAKSKLFKPAVSAKKHDAHISTFLDNYIDAIRQRDTTRLESILSKDILYYADGGDKINVIKRICTGAVDTAALLIEGFHRFQTGQHFVHAVINHQPAILCWEGDTLKAVQVLELSEDGSTILQLNNILDPEKLRNLAG